jgi:hypothetical protein
VTGYEECRECHALIWLESSVLHAEWHQRIRDAIRNLAGALDVLTGATL